MIRLAHRSLPLAGLLENGDGVFARVDPSGSYALVGVIDGLGHGPLAAKAAGLALEVLERETTAPRKRDAVAIVEDIHAALRGSRGAAATVCVLDGVSLTACGVGNVALRSRGTSVPFVLSPGVLGARVQGFRGVRATLKKGDRLVLHSDGVGSRFSLESIAHLGTDEACDSIFATHRKPTDDASVLVLDVGS